MRKALGLAILGCALVLGFACSGDSSSPTAAAVSSTSDLQNVTAEAKNKVLICHGTSSDNSDGVVVDMSGNGQGTHFKHLDAGDDCEITCGEPEVNELCDFSACLC